MTTILGAGISGLMAGCLFQNARIIEGAGPEGQAHKAVLRFRTPAVGDAVGIEFRKVLVHKGVWSGGFVEPNIRLANLYSLKTIQRVNDRSVWSTAPVERWIAPEDFIPQMRERCKGRIEYDHVVTELDELFEMSKIGPVISTMPMPVLVRITQARLQGDVPEFKRAPIFVSRARVVGADVFQTIYFPEHDTPVYRASMTGDLLTVESMGEMSMDDYSQVIDAFGFGNIGPSGFEKVDGGKQHYGKIAPVDDTWRRSFIRDVTQNHGIYALGRFAVWKNILADDVLHDIAVIKRLLKGDAYSRRMAS